MAVPRMPRLTLMIPRSARLLAPHLLDSFAVIGIAVVAVTAVSVIDFETAATWLTADVT